MAKQYITFSSTSPPDPPEIICEAKSCKHHDWENDSCRIKRDPDTCSEEQYIDPDTLADMKLHEAREEGEA